jgi:hypothetical protein
MSVISGLAADLNVAYKSTNSVPRDLWKHHAAYLHTKAKELVTEVLGTALPPTFDERMALGEDIHAALTVLDVHIRASAAAAKNTKELWEALDVDAKTWCLKWDLTKLVMTNMPKDDGFGDILSLSLTQGQEIFTYLDIALGRQVFVGD